MIPAGGQGRTWPPSLAYWFRGVHVSVHEGPFDALRDQEIPDQDRAHQHGDDKVQHRFSLALTRDGREQVSGKIVADVEEEGEEKKDHDHEGDPFSLTEEFDGENERADQEQAVPPQLKDQNGRIQSMIECGPRRRQQSPPLLRKGRQEVLDQNSDQPDRQEDHPDRKSTRLNSSHVSITYAVFYF